MIYLGSFILIYSDRISYMAADIKYDYEILNDNTLPHYKINLVLGTNGRRGSKVNFEQDIELYESRTTLHNLLTPTKTTRYKQDRGTENMELSPLVRQKFQSDSQQGNLSIECPVTVTITQY